jgi:hypothetical protein
MLRGGWRIGLPKKAHLPLAGIIAERSFGEGSLLASAVGQHALFGIAEKSGG